MTLRLSDEEGDNRALDIKAVAAIFDDCVSDDDLNKNRAFRAASGRAGPSRATPDGQPVHPMASEGAAGALYVLIDRPSCY